MFPSYDQMQFLAFLFGESMSWFYNPFAYVQRKRNEYYVWQLLQHENETLCALKWAVFLAFMLAIQLFNFFSVTALIYGVLRMAFAPIRWGWQALKKLLQGNAEMLLTPSHVPQGPQHREVRFSINTGGAHEGDTARTSRTSRRRS